MEESNPELYQVISNNDGVFIIDVMAGLKVVDTFGNEKSAHFICEFLNSGEEPTQEVEQEWETSDPVKLDALNAAVNASSTQEHPTVTTMRAKEFELFLRKKE